MIGRSSHSVPGIWFRLLAHIPRGASASARCKTSGFFLWMRVIFSSTLKFKNSDIFMNLSPCLVLQLSASAGWSNMEWSKHTYISSATPWSGHSQVTKKDSLEKAGITMVISSAKQWIYFPIRFLRPCTTKLIFFPSTPRFVWVSIFSSLSSLEVSHSKRGFAHWLRF